MRHLFGLSLMLLLAGCATSSSYYQSAVGSFRGANITTLFNNWGKPTVSMQDSDGKMTYLYRTVNHSIIFMHHGHRHLANTCLAIFHTDPQGVISSTETRGRDCSVSANFIHTR